MSEQNNYPNESKVPPELLKAWQAGYDRAMLEEAFERGWKAAEAEIGRNNPQVTTQEKSVNEKLLEEQLKREQALRESIEEETRAKREERQRKKDTGCFISIIMLIAFFFIIMILEGC